MAAQNLSDIRQIWGEFTQYKCGCAVDRKGEKMSVCSEHGSNSERKGDWIQTYLGVQFWPLDPRPEEVRLLDIAHALSNLCRFTGHCQHFYSVAQHSVLVSKQVSAADAKWALLHDASEAYLADMSRPVKNFSKLGEEYKRLELLVMAAVCRKFGLSVAMPFSVKEADDVLLMTEKRDLLATANLPKWRETSQPLESLTIIPWSPLCAEHMFLQRAKELGIGDE
jgi:uncharacterized protein